MEEFGRQPRQKLKQNSDGMNGLSMSPDEGQKETNKIKEQERCKKPERPKGTFWHSFPDTTPQHSLSRFTAGYQPMSKRRK